jgi:hypothetical protein
MVANTEALEKSWLVLRLKSNVINRHIVFLLLTATENLGTTIYFSDKSITHRCVELSKCDVML